MRSGYLGYAGEARFRVVFSDLWILCSVGGGEVGVSFCFVSPPLCILDPFVHATKRSSELPLPRTLNAASDYTNKC